MKQYISNISHFLVALLLLASSLIATQPRVISKYIQPITLTETSSNLPLVDCIYVINLDSRPEKWKRASALFANAKLKVNRVSGVNGYIITEDERQELSAPYSPQLRGGQIGCLLSHLSIIHDAYKRNFQTIWIMEDDIDIVGNIQQLSPRIKELQTIDPKWDILFTDTDMRYPNAYTSSSFHFHPRPDQPLSLSEYNKPREKVSEHLLRIHHRWGTHSMIISRSGIEKIKNYFDQWALWEPIDVELHYIPNIHEYVLLPDIVTNWTKSISDITGEPVPQIAIIANWPVDTLPAKFENVKLEYKIAFLDTRACEETATLPNQSLYKKILLFNPYLSSKKLASLPKEKMVLFVWEPEILPQKYYDHFSKVYTWDDSLIDNKKFFKFYYPHVLPMQPEKVPFEQKKFTVMIASHWVPHRIDILNFFSSKPKNEFEFYGRSCPNGKFAPMYKGAIPGYHSGSAKIETLQQYKFCFCFENSLNLKGYVTEKIFDCFAAGTVPIYQGASNIELYIPKNCYIDRRDFASNEEVYFFLKNMSKKQYEKYLDNIKQYLASEKSFLFSKENFNNILYEAVTHD